MTLTWHRLPKGLLFTVLAVGALALGMATSRPASAHTVTHPQATQHVITTARGGWGRDRDRFRRDSFRYGSYGYGGYGWSYPYGGIGLYSYGFGYGYPAYGYDYGAPCGYGWGYDTLGYGYGW